MSRKSLSVIAASLALLALGVGAGNALGANALEAAGGIETGKLRDELTTPPTGGEYGANLLASNTNGPLVFTSAPTETVFEKLPQFDAFFGLALASDPEATTSSVAVSHVEFVDLSKSTQSTTTNNSPIYSSSLTSPWRVEIRGAKNTEHAGAVTISGVGLYFSTLKVELTGTITGEYVQPGVGSKCPVGGIELALKQPSLLANGSNVPELGFNNGTSGKPTFICFVAANNYAYPTASSGFGALTGEIKNN